MSDLKHQTVTELQKSRESCAQYISKLKTSLAGQEQRLLWIDKYLYAKTPQELSWEQIERQLGFKVILK